MNLVTHFLNAAITREYSVLKSCMRHVPQLPHRFIASYVAISCIYISILTCIIFLPLVYHMFSKLLLGCCLSTVIKVMFDLIDWLDLVPRYWCFARDQYVTSGLVPILRLLPLPLPCKTRYCRVVQGNGLPISSSV